MESVSFSQGDFYIIFLKKYRHDAVINKNHLYNSFKTYLNIFNSLNFRFSLKVFKIAYIKSLENQV